MKKLIYSALALAGLLFAASCQQENLEPVQDGTTVTFTVEVPEVATKGLGDNVANINDLVYAVYSTTGNSLEEVQNGAGYELLYQKNYAADVNPFNGSGRAVVNVELVNDKNYFVIFWAQVNDTWVAGDSFDLRTVSFPSQLTANNNNLAAFSGISFLSKDNLSAKKEVTLKRPFAQLNIGTKLAENFPIVLTKSTVKVKNAGSSFNLIKQVAEGNTTVEFTSKEVPTNPDHAEGKLVVNNTEYTYAAMNYILANGNVEVDYEIFTQEHGSVKNTVSNVPVAANYRTNIVGKLLTSTAEYTVVLDDFDTNENSGVVEVLTEGLMKNQNGDYEISNANGFAHAINNLFADGGTFYIHPGTYNFTGINVVPQPTKPGVILNVKANEIPVVTRSTTSFEIIGLYVDYLVSEVQYGSQALFSGLILPEDTKLVGTNNGVVGISGCRNDETDVPAELIGSGDGKVVNTASMASVKEINDAIDQGLKLIELTGDMSLTEIFVVSKEVTIDGCGHKLTSTAGRAINVSGVDGVTIKNLVIECSGERAINIIQNATNVTIDNVTATAANYTVNVATSAPNAVVNIENSTLNGLCTVNVAAEKATVTIDNSTINCNDNVTLEGEAYAALCLNKAAVEGKIEVTNSTINVAEGSDSYKAKNGAENGIITIDGSSEDVLVVVAVITFEGSDYYYGYSSLEGAVAGAQKHDLPVTLIRDLTVEESVTIEEGNPVVLDLNGKTLTMSTAITNNGNLTLKGKGAVVNANGYIVENSGELVIDGPTFNGLGVVRSNNGTVTVENGILNASSSWKNGTYQHIIKAVNTVAIINGGVFYPITSDGSNAMINVSKNSTVTINGGKFYNVESGATISQFAPYMFTYEKNGKLIINDGTFYGGWRFNAETATTDIYGGDFTVSYDGQSFNANSTHVLTIYGGTYRLDNGGKLNPEKHLAEGYKSLQIGNSTVYKVVPSNVNGVLNSEIVNPDGVTYTGDFFENPISDALHYNNYIFEGDATINVTKTYGAIILENCTGKINGDLITINNENNSVMVLGNLDLTLSEGKKLIKSTKTIYQVYMANITINGVKMTDDNIGQYLEKVGWFQVVDEI